MRGMDSRQIALIGAPTDVGASVRGASMGPDALRVAGLIQSLRGQGFTVTDYGNLAGPPNPGQPPEGGLRHLAEVVAWNRLVYDAVDAALGRGEFPLLMGGDHAIAIGSISAIAWRGERAALGAGDIDFIGIRSVDADEKQAIHTLGLQVFDMRHIDEHGMRTTMMEALHDVHENTHLHVSFDLDCLDPADAPGVGTGVRGGPTYREMQLCMEMIADTGRLASLDVVEINPALDVRNRTAELAVDFIHSLFGASTLVR